MGSIKGAPLSLYQGVAGDWMKSTIDWTFHYVIDQQLRLEPIDLWNKNDTMFGAVYEYDGRRWWRWVWDRNNERITAPILNKSWTGNEET